MYIYKYMCIYIYIYMCMYVYMCIYTYAFLYLCIGLIGVLSGDEGIDANLLDEALNYHIYLCVYSNGYSFVY